jgi:ketosteroid isomerase-like protein
LPKLCLTLLLAAGLSAQTDISLTEQVRRAEIAFAKTMADRDHAAFTSFLAEEAVFVGTNRVLRGAKEVAAGWKSLYEGPQAPFSWAPDQVQVLDSGSLALSSGPVRDPSGKRIGTFNSIWRREPGGTWKIVIDHGCPPCDCTVR